LALLLDAKGRRERTVQFGIVFVSVLMQGAVFLLSINAFGFFEARAVPFSLYKSAIYVVKWQLLDPILGLTRADGVLSALGISLTNQGDISGNVVSGGLICLSLLIVSVALLRLGKRDANQLLLIASYLIVAAFTAYFSVHRIPHNRYVVLPGIIILLALLNVVRYRLPGIGSFVEALKSLNRRVFVSLAPGLAAAALLCLSLTSGAASYWHITFNDYTNAPLWRDEVAQWRLDPQHPLGVFPHPQWKIHLKPKQ
jgi:hypothetical protein